MKRLFFALTALAMLVTSCAKDNTTTPVVEGESVVSFKVSSPEMQTRYGEGTTANKLFYAVYQNGNLMSEVSALTADEAVDINITADVKIALVSGLTYDILFWAQNEDAPYVFDGKKVTITDPLKANEEAYDAFFRNYEAHINGTAPHYVELYRPFAQLNIGTGDIEKAKEAGFDLTKTALTVKTATVLDLATGVASEPKELSFTMNAKADDEYQGFDIISMNYLLVSNAGKELVNIKFEAEDASGKKIDRSYMNVPLERNHKTYMLGNILTTTQLFNVVIIPAFDGELPETAEEKLAMAAQLGGEFTLTEDAVLTEPLVINKGVNLTIDLGGHTISQENAQAGAYSMLVNKGVLTLKNGTLDYADTATLTSAVNYVSNTIQNSGTLTIEEGVTVVNNSDLSISEYGYPHAIDNSGTLTINGGTFTNNTNYSSMRIWCNTDDDTSVTINGGTFNGSIDFQNVNAQANKGTLTINDGTFNADTYTNSAVRLLGFGVDVDEINAYIYGGTFNGLVKRSNYVGGEFNSQVFHISGGTFENDPSEFVVEGYAALPCGSQYVVVSDDFDAVLTAGMSIKEALDNGSSQILLQAGEYSLGGLMDIAGYDAVISGVSPDEVTIVGALGMDSSTNNFTLENVTFEWDGNYHGVNVPIQLKDTKGLVQFKNCVFSGANQKPTGNFGFIHATNGVEQLVVEGCTFDKCAARFAIFGHIGTSATTTSKIIGNNMIGGTYGGGGFGIEGPMTVQNVEIKGNNITGYFRIVASNDSYALKNIVIEDNTLSQNLGYATTTNVENVIFKNNKKTNGTLWTSPNAKFITE